MDAGQSPKYHKMERAHFVFDAKYDDRNKAKLVADEHLTYVSLSSV